MSTSLFVANPVKFPIHSKTTVVPASSAGTTRPRAISNGGGKDGKHAFGFPGFPQALISTALLPLLTKGWVLFIGILEVRSTKAHSIARVAAISRSRVVTHGFIAPFLRAASRFDFWLERRLRTIPQSLQYGIMGARDRCDGRNQFV
jgi:hypothetical protein